MIKFMKTSLLISLFFVIQGLNAQNTELLIENDWKIQEFYALHEDTKISFYHPDSTDNTDNFDGVIYDFKPNDVLEILAGDTVNTLSEWSFSGNGDSIALNGAVYEIVSLNSDQLLFKQTVLQHNMEFDYYYHLKPAIITAISGTLKGNQAIELYPVPSKGEFTINSILHYNPAKVSVHTIDGRELNTFTLKDQKQQSLLLNNLLSGIYILKFYGSDDEIIDVKKVIIDK